MAKKFTELSTASQINETDITAISQETGGVWGSFKATISAIAQKIITGINFANAFNTSDKTVAGAVNEKLTSNAVADIEVSPAESAHSVDEYIIYNGILYKVTSAIAIGDSLAVGTNIAVETLNERIDNKVSKAGDTMTGDLTIDGTTSSRLFLGNNTNNNIRGIIRMHNTNGKFVQLYPNNTTADRNIELPDKNGTIALTSDVTNLITEIQLSSSADFTYSSQYKFWQSNKNISAILKGKTLVGIVIYSSLANAVMSCVKDSFGKFSVSGIDVSSMSPTTSSQGFTVSLFVK